MNLNEKIFKAGVVGAGGAGFPTHVKLNCKVEYLIINASECEPLLKTDQFIMRTKAEEIIKAIEEMAKSIEAKKMVIGLKKKYKIQIESLTKAIEKLNSKVELHLMDNFYPAGDEQILVYEVTGRVIPPGGIPLKVGAVVSNIATVYNIYEAMNDNPVIYRHVSVLGEVNKPVILKVPIGASVNKCIQEAGGTSIANYCAILGGPMMGKIFTKTELQEKVITKTTGAILVIPNDHYIVNKNNISIEHIINRAKSACIQCTNCTQMCPRYLIGHPIQPHKIMRAAALLKFDDCIKTAHLCSECGVCELYACPMGLSPRKVNIYFKNLLREKGIRYENSDSEFSPREMREFRKIPVNRLIARLNLNKYDHQEITGFKEISVSKVSIPLKQHIGAPAQAVVTEGQKVRKGEMIGEVKEGNLGANVHSSIDGKVIEIGNDVVIQYETGEVI